jgi:hypothetical protein
MIDYVDLILISVLCFLYFLVALVVFFLLFHGGGSSAHRVSLVSFLSPSANLLSIPSSLSLCIWWQ